MVITPETFLIASIVTGLVIIITGVTLYVIFPLVLFPKLKNTGWMKKIMRRISISPHHVDLINKSSAKQYAHPNSGREVTGHHQTTYNSIRAANDKTSCSTTTTNTDTKSFRRASRDPATGQRKHHFIKGPQGHGYYSQGSHWNLILPGTESAIPLQFSNTEAALSEYLAEMMNPSDPPPEDIHDDVDCQFVGGLIVCSSDRSGFVDYGVMDLDMDSGDFDADADADMMIML